jgi:hypothetical protein
VIGPSERGLAWQAVRAVHLAVIAVGLSVVAHVAAGGAAPSVTSLALLTVLSAVVSLPILLRWRSPAALIPLLTAAQGVLHPTFGVLTDASGGAHTGHALPGSGAWSSTMVVAHLAAGLLAASLVVLVDRLLRSAYLGRLQRPALTAPVVRSAVAGALPVRTRPAWAAVAADLLDAAPRRGPPAACGA